MDGESSTSLSLLSKRRAYSFSPGEAGHRGGSVASGFACEMVAAVMAKVEEGFVVRVAAEPKRLKRVARVAGGFGHEESVPE